MENCISINNISFFYVNEDAPPNPQDLTREDLTVLFEDFSLTIPGGVTSLIGENGIGKSTLLLLAGARLFPAAGSIYLFGTDTATFRSAYEDPRVEEARNQLVSFVYQNMEFETDETLGSVLEHVATQSPAAARSAGILKELVREFDLENDLNRSTVSLSKGAMQRAVIAMAVLYGSRLILLDEPIFALEEPQKARALGYLQDYAHRTNTSIVFSAHQLHLCEKYSDFMLILRKNPEEGALPYFFGPTSEIATKKNIETAYRVPFETLHQKEFLYREMLQKSIKKD
ncbi:MAG: ABC transporter ATP-binding protein [Spirochaetales bacterium]|nr:ABC transporter ATP-binding protein [Spirochaetales bacterium]